MRGGVVDQHDVERAGIVGGRRQRRHVGRVLGVEQLGSIVGVGELLDGTTRLVRHNASVHRAEAK